MKHTDSPGLNDKINNLLDRKLERFPDVQRIQTDNQHDAGRQIDSIINSL